MDCVYFLAGVIFGTVIANVLLYIRYKVVGTLKIDHTNPEKDVYRFEVDNLDALNDKKMVFLKVDNDANLSQK